MGPEFWKLDKSSRLKKCSEQTSHPCSDETDGCCAVVACEYCLIFTVVDRDTEYGIATGSAGIWTGTVDDASFLAWWERNYSTGECQFVVTLDDDEIYRSGCADGTQCRDSSDSASVTIGYNSGTLQWVKREFLPLPYVTDDATNCKVKFCGDCDCTCDTLCVIVDEPATPPVELDPYLCEGNIPICGMCDATPDTTVYGELPNGNEDACLGPNWRGTIANRLFSLTLSRGTYGECLLGGTIDGETVGPTTVTDCKAISATWTLSDDTIITVSCKDCNCTTVDPPVVSDCCDSVPCMYCIELSCYDGATSTTDLTYSDGGWSGLIAGHTISMYWTRDEYDECIFVVEFDGEIVYSKSIAEGQSCDDNSDFIELTIEYNDCTLTWTKYEPRPLPRVEDPTSYELVPFCGTSDCACPTLIATLVTPAPDCCSVTTILSDVAYECYGPEWAGTVTCNGTSYDISITLTKREYDGACVLGGSIDGTELDESEVLSASDMTAEFTLYDGTVLSIECAGCDLPDDAACVTGCCWPLRYSDLYPCGYRIPIPYEITAPGCDLDGTVGEFTPTAVPASGDCGGCGAAPPEVHSTIGVIKVPAPGTSYCNDSPCSVQLSLVLACEDEATVYGLDDCCGGFRLWVGSTERFVGWDGTAPEGGSSELYWIKLEPSSCGCDPSLSLIFEVSLVLDCPETHPGPSCAGQPKDCCIPVCTEFTLTI